MSEEDLESGINFGIIQEISKMKYNSEEIKSEIQKPTIDRLKIKAILFELSGIAQTIQVYMKATVKDPTEKNATGLSRDEVMKAYQGVADSLLNYAKVIDDTSKESDSRIRNNVFEIVTKLNVEINFFETHMIAQNHAINPFGKILEFIAEKPVDLDEKWVAAVCHLSAFDVLVNKKRKEFGIAKKPEDEKKLDFYTRFDELVKELESRSRELSKISKQMPKLFWPIRVDVIHYGYIPSEEELDLIINWSKDIMKIISEESK